ncbi:arginine-glutamic acid dipeptide repeats protein-like [Physella acuta]|uniref:arginine-glutamic acid dipeptide repeats protein-like n=1 Tax=Physella acuta TaxID=109671 RepID=UPI0027DB2962|nr:arginine-glutamic acid dipeptide repeats protein-like [Physella acuta]XP_059172511.1 arginine-glutamic acid dipeptide repeats protein-like [Physella acuta]XP_059172517.1 arginine-glutamic acid dipeptide repeats protein-like [Physella acuta]
MSTKKKDRDLGKKLDLSAHEKFLEEKVKQYKEKLEAQAKAATTSKPPSTSDANTTRLLGKSSNGSATPKRMPNLFNNDGSFMDQFKKMTGQAAKKGTVSLDSKALLQTKVKTELSQSNKLDTVKYHKQPAPAIVLPSFKLKDSSQFESKEDKDVKDEIKQEKQDYNESSTPGFGSYGPSKDDPPSPPKIPSNIVKDTAESKPYPNYEPTEYLPENYNSYMFNELEHSSIPLPHQPQYVGVFPQVGPPDSLAHLTVSPVPSAPLPLPQLPLMTSTPIASAPLPIQSQTMPYMFSQPPPPVTSYSLNNHTMHQVQNNEVLAGLQHDPHLVVVQNPAAQSIQPTMYISGPPPPLPPMPNNNIAVHAAGPPLQTVIVSTVSIHVPPPPPGVSYHPTHAPILSSGLYNVLSMPPPNPVANLFTTPPPTSSSSLGLPISTAGIYGAPPATQTLPMSQAQPMYPVGVSGAMYGQIPLATHPPPQTNPDVGMYGPHSVSSIPHTEIGMYGPVSTNTNTSMTIDGEEYDPAAPTDDLEGSTSEIDLPAVSSTSTSRANSISFVLSQKPSSKVNPPLSAGAFRNDTNSPVCPPEDEETLKVIEQLAVQVMLSGPQAEQRALEEHANDPLYWFLKNKSSDTYKYFQRQVEKLIKPSVKQEPSNDDESGNGNTKQPMKKKRKSRWSDEKGLGMCSQALAPPGVIVPSLAPTNIGVPTIPGVVTNIQLGGVTTIQPHFQLPPVTQIPVPGPTNMQDYARKVIGSDSITEEQLKQIREQQEMNFMYELVMAQKKMQEQALMAEIEGVKVKRKYEYDSDEETEGGTWEHRQRAKEMDATKKWAEKLTSGARGKHFLGDFLPPEELEKFMETFKALKDGREPDYSDYKEFKLTCENMGYQMLVKLGWKEGTGLGAQEQGITKPVNKGNTSVEGRGLGIERPAELTKDDDEFDAYRKRMMLAYRFRPNPLNNPRRPYY